MSVPHFGRITPLQGPMFGLGGIILVNLDEQVPTDDERISKMKRVLDALHKGTSRDCAYDLRSWHKFLLENKEHRGEYTHSYAWRGVRREILQLIDDADRFRLFRLIESSESSNSPELRPRY